MPESKHACGVSRRSFVQASGAALILTATAVIHPIEAWGLEAKGLAPAAFLNRALTLAIRQADAIADMMAKKVV